MDDLIAECRRLGFSFTLHEDGDNIFASVSGGKGNRWYFASGPTRADTLDGALRLAIAKAKAEKVRTRREMGFANYTVT